MHSQPRAPHQPDARSTRRFAVNRKFAAIVLALVTVLGMASTSPALADTGSRIAHYALSQVGKPYVANTQGPRAFDCSGLTQWAIRKATGRTYVHSSRAQFRTMLRIPKSKLRPGDLVFFFRKHAHHVAIYIGSGRIVHAANPRRGVVVDRLSAGWFQQHLSGYARVLR
ncbi:MAG: NlpC/P60 family protein [Actinobacteria bacterium]|nr:NlpC/P60 family protein [Actinomycetota bacterium]